MAREAIPPEVIALKDRLEGRPGVARVGVAPEDGGWSLVVFCREPLGEEVHRAIAAGAGSVKVVFLPLGTYDLSAARPAFPGRRRRAGRRPPKA